MRLDGQGDPIQRLKIPVEEGQVLDPDFILGVWGHNSYQQSALNVQPRLKIEKV
jgi:hypothetical protein